MSIKADYKDSVNATLTITVSPTTYKGKVDRELREYAKKANIPGFRKGQAPIGMVKRMAGKPMILDTISKIISEELYDYIEEQKLEILGKPLPVKFIEEEDVDLECTKEVSIDFEIGLAPDFELNLMPSKALPHYNVEVDDAFLNEKIEELRKRFGKSDQVEEVAEGDWIFGRLEEVDANGEAVENGISKLVTLNPDNIDKKELFAVLIGLKKEDKVALDVFSYFENDEEIKQALKFTEDEVASIKGVNLVFIVKRITRTSMADLDQAFFDKVVGPDKVTDEESFKAALVQNISHSLAKESADVFYYSARKELLDINQFSLPDDFLKKWLLSNKDSKVTEENVEEIYDRYQENFKWEMIEGRLEKKYPELIPTTEQLDEHIWNLIDMYSNQPDSEGMDDKETFKQLKKDKDFIQRQYSSLKENFLRNFLEGNMPHTHAHITASEFQNIQV